MVRQKITTETPLTVPFTVLVDTAEGQPFSFAGFRGDAKEKNRPLVVPWKWQALGRHPDSRGDYSIEGLDRAGFSWLVSHSGRLGCLPGRSGDY